MLTIGLGGVVGMDVSTGLPSGLECGCVTFGLFCEVDGDMVVDDGVRSNGSGSGVFTVGSTSVLGGDVAMGFFDA